MFFKRILFFNFYLLSGFQAFSADEGKASSEEKCKKAVNALSETDKKLTEQHAGLVFLLSPVHNLNLSRGPARALENDHIEFIWELVQKTEEELLQLPRIGHGSLREIRNALRNFKLMEFAWDNSLKRVTYSLSQINPSLTHIISFLLKIEGKLTNRDIHGFLLSLLGTDKELTDQNIQRAIILTFPIDTLLLSGHSEYILKSNGINYILELVRKTERELLELPNFGRKNLDEIKEELSSSDLSVGMEWPLNPETWLEASLGLLLSPVHTLKLLSVRSANVLKNNHIEFIWELVQKTERELLELPNFGRKNLDEIKEALSSLGLSVGMSGMGIIDFKWFLNLDQMKKEIILPLDLELIENLILASHFQIDSRTLLDYLSFKNPLTLIEEKVIKLRLALRKRGTFRKIGQYLNRSFTRVKQIEDSAIGKLFRFGRKLGVVKGPIPDDQKERNEIVELMFQVVLSLERNKQQNAGRVESSPEKEEEKFAETDNRYEGQDDKKEPSPLLLSAPIDILNLPLRSHFALKDSNIAFIWKLVEKTEDKLSLPKEHLNEIKRELSRFDLDLGMVLGVGIIRNFTSTKAYFQERPMRFSDNHIFFGPMNSREEKVLRMRFGLEGGKRHSFGEIGKHFDITSKMIQRIEKRAFGKLLVQFGKQLRIDEYFVSTTNQQRKKVVELVFQILLLSLYGDRQQSFRQKKVFLEE